MFQVRLKCFIDIDPLAARRSVRFQSLKCTNLSLFLNKHIYYLKIHDTRENPLPKSALCQVGWNLRRRCKWRESFKLGCGRRLIQVKRNSRELNHNTLTTLTKVLTLERKKEFRTYIYPLPQTISSSFVL